MSSLIDTETTKQWIFSQPEHPGFSHKLHPSPFGKIRGITFILKRGRQLCTQGAHKGAKKWMWIQLVIVDGEKGDAKGWGFCILKLGRHRTENQNQSNTFLVSSTHANPGLTAHTELV